MDTFMTICASILLVGFGFALGSMGFAIISITLEALIDEFKKFRGGLW